MHIFFHDHTKKYSPIAFFLALSLSPHRYKNFRLPGLEKYTPEQLFFISFGRLWCQKETPELSQQTILGDTHAPPKWRINGPVQNLPDFADVFKCKAGTPMSPAKRCDLW